MEGWKAVPTKIYQYTSQRNGVNQRYCTDSFDVHECPEFELMEFIKMQKVEPDGVTRHIEGESIVDSLLRRKYYKASKERVEG